MQVELQHVHKGNHKIFIIFTQCKVIGKYLHYIHECTKIMTISIISTYLPQDEGHHNPLKVAIRSSSFEAL